MNHLYLQWKFLALAQRFQWARKAHHGKRPDSFHKQPPTDLSGEADLCPRAGPQLLEVLLVKGADITYAQRQDTIQYEPIQIEQSLLEFPGTDSLLSKLSQATCSRVGWWLWHKKHLPSNLLIPLKPSSLDYLGKCCEAQQEPWEERFLKIRHSQLPAQRLNTLRNFVSLRSLFSIGTCDKALSSNAAERN